MNRLLFFIFIWVTVTKVNSQTVSPQVINSAGGSGAVGSSTMEVYYNIGEPFISTINNGTNVITQGFLQPDIVGDFALSITPLFQNESCLNKQDGFISLVLNSVPSSATNIQYIWSPSLVCPTQNCSSVDSLAPGNYSIVVKALTAANVLVDSVVFNYNITANTEPCQITVYNGFTPDGDGINDKWVIENIQNFSNNTVSIFNRWGNKLWTTSNYNNETNFWDGKGQNGSVLPSGTYFYIIEIDGGSGVKKGWVELTGK